MVALGMNVKNGKQVRRVSTVFGVSLPLFYLFWIVFVGTFSLHELLIGVVGSVLAAAGLSLVDLVYPARFSPRLRDVLALWRIPWGLWSGMWQITEVALKDLLGIKRAPSLFRVAPFDAGNRAHAQDTARRVLAVVAMTVTPSTIALGVNTSDQKLLFHEMGRRRLPKMLQSLGARH